jgi:hypothetical protein
MVTKTVPLCRVKLLKNGRDKLVVRSPEKAGVGGSTPSLATIIPKDIIRIRPVAASPLSVRILSKAANAVFTTG